MRSNIYYALLLAVTFTSHAFAADPFLSDSDEDGTYVEEVRRTKEQAIQSETYSGALAELPGVEQGLKEQSDFRGTIDKLLSKARPESEEEKKAWSEFETVEGTEAETKFYNSSEYKISAELSKPLQRNSNFSNSLDEIENTLNKGKTPEAQPAVEDKMDDFFNH